MGGAALFLVMLALLLVVKGTRPRGKPKMRWKDNINADLMVAGLTEADALDGARWKRGVTRADPSVNWDHTA